MDENNNVGLCEDWEQLPYEGSKNGFIERAGDIVEDYLLETKDERNIHKEEGFGMLIDESFQRVQSVKIIILE
jgi:hypothetical protein